MKLTIGHPVIPPSLHDSYFLTITTYDGDADGSGAFRVLGFRPAQDEHLLEHLLTTLQKVKEAYPSGRGGDDHLATEVPAFDYWFSYDYPDEATLTTALQEEGLKPEDLSVPVDSDPSASMDSPGALTARSTEAELTLYRRLASDLDLRYGPFMEEEDERELAPWALRIWNFRHRTASLYSGSNPLDSAKGVWPLDSTLLDFSGAEASYSGHTVSYFDSVGVEHIVEASL